MDAPCLYEIRVSGHLTDRWASYFAGLAIHRLPCGETVLQGAVVDQAALLGILNTLHGLHLALLAVNRVPVQNDE